MESRAGGGCGRDRHLRGSVLSAGGSAGLSLPPKLRVLGGGGFGQVLLPLPRHETPVVWPEWLWAEHTLLRRRLRLRQCFPILGTLVWNQKGSFFFAGGGGAFLGEVEGQEGADGRCDDRMGIG